MKFVSECVSDCVCECVSECECVSTCVCELVCECVSEFVSKCLTEFVFECLTEYLCVINHFWIQVSTLHQVEQVNRECINLSLNTSIFTSTAWSIVKYRILELMGATQPHF